MAAPHRELERVAVPNAMGHVVLAFAERTLRPLELTRLRDQLWRTQTYLYVTPGPVLIERALEGFPPEIRALGARCPFFRYDARGGGGYWPDRNEIWLAAGVETYEGLRQVRLSSCHELFHFICWNHSRYRSDEDRGFGRLRKVVADSRPLVKPDRWLVEACGRGTTNRSRGGAPGWRRTAPGTTQTHRREVAGRRDDP